jgi:hypothetical protein
VLESCLSLLPTPVFLSSLGSLLGSKNPNIRKRALEVVTAKLGDEGENSLPPAALANLLPLLVGLATTDDQPANQMVSRTNETYVFHRFSLWHSHYPLGHKYIVVVIQLSVKS